MSDLNRDILRWLLIFGSAPVWWPFLRTLWRDFNAALEEDGGLFGRAPTGRELERVRRARAARPSTLLSERLVKPGDRRRARLGARNSGRAGASAGAGSGAGSGRAAGSDTGAARTAPDARATRATGPRFR